MAIMPSNSLLTTTSQGLMESPRVAPLVPPRSETQEQPSGVASLMDNSIVARASDRASAANPDLNLERYTQPTREMMQRAAEQIQGYLTDSGRDLNFRVDNQAGYYVTSVINPNNGELIRQIPSDELLRIARNIQQMPALQGMLVDRRA
jgi:flagellar protein FlaG